MLAYTHRTPLFFALLAAGALVGFWKPYLASLTAAMPLLVHLHAALMAAWCALLIMQPLLMRRGQRGWHRALGRSAWVLAPAIVGSSLWLAVLVTRPAAGAAIEPFRYALFFVQVATAVVFAVCAAMALLHRRDAPLHARWMVASGITFIDPVFARVFGHLGPPWPVLVDYGSVLLTAVVLAIVMLAERHARHGRHVLPQLLAMLVALHVAALVIGDWAPWRRVLEDRRRGQPLPHASPRATLISRPPPPTPPWHPGA
jgi:hypothetical protein